MKPTLSLGRRCLLCWTKLSCIIQILFRVVTRVSPHGRGEGWDSMCVCLFFMHHISPVFSRVPIF